MPRGYPPELIFTIILVQRGKVKKNEIDYILKQAYKYSLIDIEPSKALKRVEKHIRYLVERGLVQEINGFLVVTHERIPLVPLRLAEYITRVMESNGMEQQNKEH